jgi:hypothetical protein
MSKIQTRPDVAPHPAMSACRVLRVDACNAVCMIDNPACTWATPYGNYCEHPLKDRLADYRPAEADGSGRSAVN